jgi:AraC family transcriptional regulator
MSNQELGDEIRERLKAVKEVAASCGFADQAHLTRVFRCRLGSTPAQVRRGSRD